MDLLQQLTNPGTAEVAASVAGALGSLPTNPRPPRPRTGDRQARHRAVEAAIVEVLVQARGPLAVSDVHDCVSALTGEPMKYASVKAGLARLAARAEPVVVRVDRGVYRATGGP